RPRVDYPGALLLTGGLTALLLRLFALERPSGWLLLGLALLLLLALVLVERRAADPIVPLPLFRDRLFTVACLHGLLAGCALFGSTAFVPLLVQASAGTSATVAGATLTPMLLAWVLASIVGSRLLLRVNYRFLALTGMVLLTLGSLLLWRLTETGSQAVLVLSTGLMGGGMGLSIPAFLIAVQSTVSRRVLGAATSSLQFSRSIGGTIGVSVMGVVLSTRLAAALSASSLDPAVMTLDRLLEPMQHVVNPSDATLRTALIEAMGGVFLIALLAAGAGLIATALAPGGHVTQLASRKARDAQDERQGTAVHQLDDTLPVQH
ncbi:MAG: MFS transporter, partial [Chloroflexota bacterium]|nr:MFS transporter [Chloroflexota bacterium]